MTFLELAKSRYSVRSFTDQPIEDETLNKILEAGHVAPTLVTINPQKYMWQRVKLQERSWHLCAAVPSMHL